MTPSNLTFETTVKVKTSIFTIKLIAWYVNACNWLTLKKCKLLNRTPIQLTIDVYYPDGGEPVSVEDALGAVDTCEDVL